MLKQLSVLVLFGSTSCLLQACSNDSGTRATGGTRAGGSLASSGGSSSAMGGTTLATGGTSQATGGTSMQTGGTTQAAGATATVGTTATGGTTAAGGTPASSGTTTKAGTTASGGTQTTGGAKGGTTSAAGSSASVGTTAKAGTTATGGTKTGGTILAGGTTATGGATATGGTPTPTTPGAPEKKPLGYGQATTGGGSATTVDASSFAAVQAAIDAYSGSGGLAIRYTGKFNFASITDPCTQWKLPAQVIEIKKKNDITILGADGSAANFSIHIASSASNIIIRNMTFGLLPGADASDAITIEGMSGGVPKNIWIDHNELFSSMVECAGAGDTSFDGLIDIKKGGDNITISYNYLHDHHKVSLNGYTDDDSEIRHVTYHHNIFENVGSRTPLQRHGYSHVFNNLLSKVTTSGMNIRMDGYALIEANFFENVKNPVTSRDSSALGYWELRNNNITGAADFTKFGITWAASDSTPTKDATDWTTTKTFPVALGYTYTADPAQCVKDNLRSVVGAGKGLATLKCN